MTGADWGHAINDFALGLVADFFAGGAWVSAGWDEGGVDVRASLARKA
jgi:hypothetical protein